MTIGVNVLRLRTERRFRAKWSLQTEVFGVTVDALSADVLAINGLISKATTSPGPGPMWVTTRSNP